MLWPLRFQPQNTVCKAPFDAGRGAAVASNQSRTEGPLGKPAKYVDAETVQTSKRSRKQSRMAVQKEAKKLVPEQRVAHCMWTPATVPGLSTVDVLRRNGEARFSGLQTCGSVWACPVCSAKITEVRRQELHQLMEWAEEEGHTALLLTFTARHKVTDNLTKLLACIGGAKRRLRQSRSFRNLKQAVVGTVTALEVTHGENGWHPHYHELWIVNPNSLADPVGDIDAALRDEWLHCLAKEGLSGNGAAFDVRDGSFASDYAAKFGDDGHDGWGMPEEMTMSKSKSGRRGGRSPMQLLRDSAQGDEEAGRLWAIFARAFKGKRQLVWSNGLKVLAKIGETDDQEIAEGEEYTPEQDEVIARIPRETWYRVRHLRGEILEAAEVGGTMAVMLLLANPPPPSCHDCGSDMVLIE